MNPDTTSTPRTDKLATELWGDDAFDGEFGHFEMVTLSRQLERKLSEKTAEVARLREDVKRWKELFVNFAIVHCGQYGEQHFGKDYLHPLHYDLLKEAGARMVDFKQAELTQLTK